MEERRKFHEVCEIHEQHIALIQEIRNDTKWIRRIGVAIGGIALTMVPFIIMLFVYISHLDGRVAMLEYKIAKHTGDK